MARRVCLPRLRQTPCGRAAKPAAFVRMPRLWPANLNHRRHGDASLQIAADDMVLGRASYDNAFQRHVSITAAGAARRDLQNRLAANAKTPALDGRSGSRTTGRRCRSRSDRNAYREGDTFFEAGNAGKILIIGAVEVIDRDTNQAKPRRKHAKYLDTRSGRIRLAMITDNSAASIEAFVNANVKRGATLLTDGHKAYPGLPGYRHDPRVVGKMAAHIILPCIHRAFSLMGRWSLGTYHGLRRKHVDTYLNEFVFRYNRRFYRHVSFETLLGLAAHNEPASYWDIIKRDNPRKRARRSGVPAYYI
jgi:ISXO2-like transposase domain